MGRVLITLLALAMLIGDGRWLEAVEKEVGLRMIIVRSLKEAQDIRQELSDGASFSALAREKSIGLQRRQWGFSGVVRLDDLQDTLQPVLRRLQMGEVSDIVELEQRFALVRLMPAKIMTLFASAKQAMQESKPESAVKSLRQVLKLEPDNVPAYMMLGLAHGAAGRPAKAISFLKKAQSYAAREAQISMLLGVMYTQVAETLKSQVNAKQAIQAYQNALRLNKSLESAVEFGIGKVYSLALKQPDKAISHFEKAAVIEPNIRDIHRMLIQAYYETKRYKKALQQLRIAQDNGFKFPKLLAAVHEINK